MVRNLPCKAGDAGSIPGQGTKIPHSLEKLSPQAATRGSVSHNERSYMMQRKPCMLQLRLNTAKLKKKKKTAARNPDSVPGRTSYVARDREPVSNWLKPLGAITTSATEKGWDRIDSGDDYIQGMSPRASSFPSLQGPQTSRLNRMSSRGREVLCPLTSVEERWRRSERLFSFQTLHTDPISLALFMLLLSFSH